MQELTVVAPENLRFRTEYILASVKYADTCWNLGDVDEAKNVYADAGRRLATHLTYDKEWRMAATGLIAAHIVVGETWIRKESPGKAEEFYTVAFESAESWVTKDPTTKQGNIFLCLMNLKLVDASVLQGNYDAAEYFLDGAKDIANGTVDITSETFSRKEHVSENNH